MTFAYEAYVVNKTVLMLNFLSVIMTLWVGRRMSLFLGATSYIFKSNKTHDDCNLNGSEKNKERGRETERERRRHQTWQYMFTIPEFGGGAITVLFFQLVFRFESFENKLLEEREENKKFLIMF